MNDLIDRIESADGPSRELDYLIALARGWRLVAQDWPEKSNWHDADGTYRGRNGDPDCPPRWTASIDAALTLVPEGQGRWPQLYYISRNPNNTAQGHRWEIWTKNRPKPYRGHHKKSAALALCIVAIRAWRNQP